MTKTILTVFFLRHGVLSGDIRLTYSLAFTCKKASITDSNFQPT